MALSYRNGIRTILKNLFLSILLHSLIVCAICTDKAEAINIVLDYTLDEQNENWFDPQTAEGLARRSSLGVAAEFLSTIITNDDWGGLTSLDESFSLTDIAASSIYDLDGNLLTGVPETDGAGYEYADSSNNVDTTNRFSVAANEYIVYVAAFEFDAGSTANARGGWDSNDRRNAAGIAGTEFNTWGGRITFNTSKPWYTGLNPGVDPTDDYGFQDVNKMPNSDIQSDNWDWSTSSDSWKGFDLESIDNSADNHVDLYATGMHELMHALGATSSVIEDYAGLDANGDFIGANLIDIYGGPVPGNGGHFAVDTQSLVWDSNEIISETLLDPNSLRGVRKYFTKLDAALLKDIGYDVLDEFSATALLGDYNQDGTVDAADYTVWRDGLGTDIPLADGDNSGLVDQLDYIIWRDNYGNTLPSSTVLEVVSVPEPISISFIVFASLLSLLKTRVRE